MSHSSEERLPADLLAVAEQLREGRHEANALDLDRIKAQAVAQATRGSGRFGPRKGGLMRKRTTLATALTVGAIATGLGATMAVTGQIPPGKAPRATIASHQYPQTCAALERANRRERKRLRRANRREERALRGRARARIKRLNRREERRQRRAHRRAEARCRA